MEVGALGLFFLILFNGRGTAGGAHQTDTKYATPDYARSPVLDPHLKHSPQSLDIHRGISPSWSGWKTVRSGRNSMIAEVRPFHTWPLPW